MSIDSDILTQCRTMALKIAPELRSVPLYFLSRHESWPSFGIAWAMQGRDVLVEAWLRETGQWRGNGNVIIFDMERIEAEISDLLPNGLFALAVHEIGHIVPLREFREVDPPLKAQLQLAASSYPAAAALPPDDTKPPWHRDHGYQFTRRVIHLACRAWELGYKFEGWYLAAGEEYGMSPIAHYAYALRDEPYNMLGASFAEIEATSPPESFMEIWKRDTEAWYERNT